MNLISDFSHAFIHGLDRLENEIKQFQHESEIWKVTGDISNSAGNLTLHLIGNLNHFIGAELGKTGYVRDRDNEFVTRDLHREVLIRMISETRLMLEKTFANLNEEDLAKPFRLNTFGEGKTTGFVLILLAGHLNYHLGQINYLRRFFSPHAM